MREDVTGLPDQCRFYLRSSGKLIHHAYSLHLFEESLGRRIDQFQYILEFGGGYGSFCRLAHRLGFKGQYVIFDLPKFSALQEYFLESIGMPVRKLPTEAGVRCISDIDEARKLATMSDTWLLIALWSLSETPVAVRRDILGAGSLFGSYLLGYQERFGEVDNVSFFADWMKSQKQIKWDSVRISHMERNHYMFGVKLDASQ